MLETLELCNKYLHFQIFLFSTSPSCTEPKYMKHKVSENKYPTKEHQHQSN